MRVGYFRALRYGRFALLWIGISVSCLGDSITWLALVWLAYHLRGSAVDVGLLVAVYRAPVLVGGPLAGVALDRIGPRAAMLADNLVRGMLVGLIPVLFHAGLLRPWHLYAVAGAYGLLWMVTLAGSPTMMPLILPPAELNAANALETVSFSVSGVLGLPLAGVLLSIMSGADVLVFDAASYFILVGCLLAIGPVGTRRDTRPPHAAARNRGSGLRPAIQFSLGNRFIRNSTVMYMMLNIGRGILDVLIPVILLRGSGGSRILGLVMAGAAVGDLAGAVCAGLVRTGASYPKLIARSLGLNAFPLLVFAREMSWAVWALAFAVTSFVQAPLTIWAQTERMRLIPLILRGRVFALLRTVMQTGPAIGGIVGSVVVGALPRWEVTGLIVALMSGPGLLALLAPNLLNPGSAPSEAGESSI
jgi:MFS family permease